MPRRRFCSPSAAGVGATAALRPGGAVAAHPRPTCIVRVREQLEEHWGRQRQAGMALQRNCEAGAGAAARVHAALRPAVGRQRRRGRRRGHAGGGGLRAICACCSCRDGVHGPGRLSPRGEQ